MNTQDNNTGFYSNISKIVNFFRRSPGSGFLFCVCDNEALIREINRLIKDKFDIKIRDIYLISENLDDFIQRIGEAAATKPDGIIISNLDELIDLSKGQVVRRVNFARETLIELDVPLMFWLSENSISQFSNKAPDLFLRRDRSVISFSNQAIEDELNGVKAAIAAQERLHGYVPDDVLKTTLTILRDQLEGLKNMVSFFKGSGAIAVGDGSVAAGAGGVAIGGDIHGNLIVTADSPQFYGEIPPGEAVRTSEEALQIYRRVIFNAERYLPLRGVELGAADPTSGRQRMDLAKVYVDLSTKSNVPIEVEGSRRKKGVDAPEVREMRPLGALEVAAKHRHMVLLGNPGSGKSTFVNHLALCLAGCKLEPHASWEKDIPDWPKDEVDIIPIPVVLRDFGRSPYTRKQKAEANHLWTFIVRRLKAQKLVFATRPLEQSLEEGRAIVLLDGLDEIANTDQRKFLRDAVAAFAERYPKIRVIVTCRVLSYQDPDWQLAEFPVFELAPFDEDRINQFVEAWYTELGRLGEIKTMEESKTLSGRLKEAVRRPDLWSLALNPLLLTVMALVHTHKGRLPEARSLLYEDSLDILLWRWDQIKAGGEKSFPRMQELLLNAERSEVDLKRLLWRLAFNAHRETGGATDETLADVKEWQLSRTLAELHPDRNMDWAYQMINTIKLRAGMLIEREPGVYTFPHRTFQEYLAGSHLSTWANFAREASKLVEEGVLWREVVLFAVGRLVYLSGDYDKPLALVGELCPSKPDDRDIAWRKAWMAGDVLLEIGLNRIQESTLGKDLLFRVRDRLAGLLASGHLEPGERAAAGNTLSRLGDPRFRPDTWYLTDEPLLGFVEIQEGPFLMGSDKEQDQDAYEDESPRHTVHLPSYYISRYPVNVAQFRAFIQQSGYQPQGSWEQYGEFENHPVVSVTWYDAVEYCQWLTKKFKVWEGMPEPISSTIRDQGWQVRLPTEAEWENAARGTDGRRFPWGDAPASTDKANYGDTGIGSTSAVGCFPGGGSPYGCQDMAGNVWEWTHTLWETDIAKKTFKYPYNLDDGRENESAGSKSMRVLRGGSFYDPVRSLRCAYRFRLSPDLRDRDIGFRVVVAPGFSSDL